MSSTAKDGKGKTKTVGQILARQREAKGLTLKQVETATRVRGKYLIAIEADDYGALPHDIYTKGFIQSYADHIGLNGRQIAGQYATERGGQPVQLGRQTAKLIPNRTVSTRSITIAGVAGLLLMVAVYLFWQFSALTAAPKLEVTNPDKDQVLYGSLITVSGRVGGGADVYVNDSPILSDAQGNFADAIALQDGVNAIRVTAKNRLGKSTTVTRNILARVPKTDPSSSLPGAVFDGVAVSVQVKDATAAVTVLADGKEIFKGTMLPGTVQTFKATGKLTISTSNAGATLLKVTNSVVAGEDVGPTGPMGQSRNNLEFLKDTRFAR